MKPMIPPTTNATGIASQAQLASVPPKAINTKANMTALTETVPSMERSIDPMMIMNVTPMATIRPGVAATAIRDALRMEKKRESIR